MSAHRLTLAGVDVGGSGIRIRIAHGGRNFETLYAKQMPRINGTVNIAELGRFIIDKIQFAMRTFSVDRLSGLGIGMAGIPGGVDSIEGLRTPLSAHVE